MKNRKNRYKSKQFQKMYEDILTSFEQEGDVYSSMKESIENDYKHKLIPDGITKSVLISVLNTAAIDFYLDNFKILKEEEFLKTI